MITNIISTLVTAITDFGTAAVGAIVENFDTLVVGADGNLTNVATWGLCFMGVSLVIGLGRLCMNLVRSRA